ncbi:MAG: SagB/ThcOx family dehydrogenase [Bacteroidales bacterium]|nr:SagB/ThcOx family dehydrogenase [Bacteroidales bacterium]MCF8326725.1 SagB/ThcOx family dehydrogenase [Bacteroidales bacterium]
MKFMKFTLIILQIVLFNALFGQGMIKKAIELPEPEIKEGALLMEALAERASMREFREEPISLQHISNMLWAANGINRPEEEKRTAPSAINAQDIDVYVFFKSAVYRYDAHKHMLSRVKTGDYREQVAARQEFVLEAPVIFLLVSDFSRFDRGDQEQKFTWANMDAGFVGQNILLYCASENFATVPRAQMNKDKLRDILDLEDSQHLMLNFPVSHKAK